MRVRMTNTEIKNLCLDFASICVSKIGELYPDSLLVPKTIETLKKLKNDDNVIDSDDIIEWIIKNVSSNVVPADEGNGDALVYNLVHLAAYGSGFNHYDYEPKQDAEIKALYEKYGREYNE
jgi:hypothetical protein